MNQLAILSIEDEPEVRAAIQRDLRPFHDSFRIEAAEDVEDAREAVRLVEADGDQLALILCDHRLPGTSGVDFLTELHADPERRAVRKVLLTGQAGQQDTIRAINQGGLQHYIAKPWQTAELVEVVRHQLTEFVLAADLDPLPYLAVLDGSRLLERLSRGPVVE